MSGDTIIALVIFLLPLMLSPGPGNAFFAGLGATQGFRAAVPALAGYHVATFVVTTAVGAGLGVTVLRLPVVSKMLAAVGALYVLWLAFTFVRAARARGRARDTAAQTMTPDNTAVLQDASARRVGFWSGALVLVLNPKAYYIMAVMFTQFLRPPATDDLATVVSIAAVCTATVLACFTLWTAAGGALALLFRNDRARRWMDYFFAVVLVGVAIWMALPLFA